MIFALESTKRIAQRLKDTVVTPPVEIQKVATAFEAKFGAGERIPPTETLRELKERLLANPLEKIDRRDWQQFPWILWFEDEAIACHEQLMAAFFQQLQGAKSARLAGTVIRVYICQFPAHYPSLLRVLEKLHPFIETSPRLKPWRELQHRHALFVPKVAPHNLAVAILQAPSWQGGLDNLGLSMSAYQGPDGLLQAVFDAAIKLMREKLEAGIAE